MLIAPPALHVENLNAFTWLRKECRSGDDRAAQLFDLDAGTASFYTGLSDAALEALCAELDVSLLVPRFDCLGLRQAMAGAKTGRRGRQISELEIRNMASLIALHEACERSIGNAVWTYRISQETADAYRLLSYNDTVALAKGLSMSAFVPRYGATEAARILDTPEGARALFAAAYETEITTPSYATRRSHFPTH